MGAFADLDPLGTAIVEDRLPYVDVAGTRIIGAAFHLI
jgi:hypothetical protein